MIPWELLDEAVVPGHAGAGEPLRLYRRGDEYAIRIHGRELMNSRMHASEEELARRCCAMLAAPRPRVLIGGLGMGYTLAAALASLGPAAEVTVAELVPAVVAWNRGPLASLAGRPLADRRVKVRETDVAELLRDPGAFDGVLLDVDNGPDAFCRVENERLYRHRGLRTIHDALRPRGVLGVWSAGPDRAFGAALRKSGFRVEMRRVHAREGGKGPRHTLWIGVRSG